MALKSFQAVPETAATRKPTQQTLGKPRGWGGKVLTLCLTQQMAASILGQGGHECGEGSSLHSPPLSPQSQKHSQNSAPEPPQCRWSLHQPLLNQWLLFPQVNQTAKQLTSTEHRSEPSAVLHQVNNLYKHSVVRKVAYCNERRLPTGMMCHTDNCSHRKNLPEQHL